MSYRPGDEDIPGRGDRCGSASSRVPVHEHSWSLRRGEERELAKQLACRSNKAFCDLNSLFSFVRRGRVSGYVRIFQLVAAPPEVCKRPEALSELGPDRALTADGPGCCDRVGHLREKLAVILVFAVIGDQ